MALRQRVGRRGLALTVAAALSMFVGSILATVQSNMKRLMAYSSIAHAGYLLMALPGLSQQGIAAAAFYSLAYLFMTVGAFAIIVWLGDAPESGSEMARYESLFYRRPYLAGALALFLLALAGTPATAGFVGKVLLVRNAMEFGGWLLVAALAVTTGISAYAYLRVVLVMIRRPAAAQVVEGAAWHEAAAAEDRTRVKRKPGGRHLGLWRCGDRGGGGCDLSRPLSARGVAALSSLLPV